MHKKTKAIIKNLGFSDELLKTLEKQTTKTPISRRTLSSLKELGIPKTALEQIKYLEGGDGNTAENLSNKELLETLIKKCRRSFNAFANKNIKARIIFSDNAWTIFSETYNKGVEKLHKVCKDHFDEWALQGLNATFVFDGDTVWKILTDKESDLPDISE